MLVLLGVGTPSRGLGLVLPPPVPLLLLGCVDLAGVGPEAGVPVVGVQIVEAVAPGVPSSPAGPSEPPHGPGPGPVEALFDLDWRLGSGV